MNNPLFHLGAPATAVVIAALVSSAAVLGARLAVPEGCASARVQGGSVPSDRPAAQAESKPAARLGGARGDVEQRIASARGRLTITPEQAPLWDAFAEAVRDHAWVRDSLAEQSAAAIEPIAQHLHHQPVGLIGDKADAAAHGASEKQFAAAWTALYDRLTEEQRETAASLLIWHDSRGR